MLKRIKQAVTFLQYSGHLSLPVLLLMSSFLQAMEFASPANGAKVSLLFPDWQRQIIKRSHRAVKALDKVNMDDRLDLPEKIVFAIKNGSLTSDSVLEISLDPKFVKIAQTLSFANNKHLQVTNLEVNRTYYWRLRSGRKVLLKQHFFTLPNTPRFIAVPGGKPGNVRDLGGKKTLDGNMTVQGKIYRGTEMHNHFAITSEGKSFMLDFLKIRSDLDFRYPHEIAKYSQSPLGPQVKWITIPINAYKSFTPQQNDLFRDAIKFFANPAHYPIYMHCSGGVDRTGEIAYLLNMILNVDEETALLDYEASSLSFFPRKRSIPYFEQWRKTIANMSPPGTSSQQQVVNYLKKIGVTEQDIKSIRKIMIERLSI